jgi:hypothetical protein
VNSFLRLPFALAIAACSSGNRVTPGGSVNDSEVTTSAGTMSASIGLGISGIGAAIRDVSCCSCDSYVGVTVPYCDYVKMT